jgi:hypothetical protein
MRTISSILLLALVLTATVALAGDPLDANDGPKVIVSVNEMPPGCDDAIRWPSCEPCWTTCFYALMAQSYMSGGDWGQW